MLNNVSLSLGIADGVNVTVVSLASTSRLEDTVAVVVLTRRWSRLAQPL